eukprot:g2235.t1
MILVTGPGHVANRYNDLFKAIASSELVTNNENIMFKKMSIYDNLDLAQSIDVQEIPTILFGGGVRGRKRRRRKVKHLPGASSANLREVVEQFAKVSVEDSLVEKVLETSLIKEEKENRKYTEDIVKDIKRERRENDGKASKRGKHIKAKHTQGRKRRFHKKKKEGRDHQKLTASHATEGSDSSVPTRSTAKTHEKVGSIGDVGDRVSGISATKSAGMLKKTPRHNQNVAQLSTFKTLRRKKTTRNDSSATLAQGGSGEIESLIMMLRGSNTSSSQAMQSRSIHSTSSSRHEQRKRKPRN